MTSDPTKPAETPYQTLKQSRPNISIQGCVVEGATLDAATTTGATRRTAEPAETGRKYWCCSADFGEHEPTCPNFVVAEPAETKAGPDWEASDPAFDPEPAAPVSPPCSHPKALVSPAKWNQHRGLVVCPDCGAWCSPSCGEVAPVSPPRKKTHPLKFSTKKGLLAEALGISGDDPDSIAIEKTVERALSEHWNMRNLFQTVGAMEITDEMWANFLYTYGFWDGGRQ